MTNVQTAASESVDQVLQSASGHRFTDQDRDSRNNPPYQASSITQKQPQYPQFLVDRNGSGRLYHHQRGGSNGSGGSGNMGPPPPRPAAGYGDSAFNLRMSTVSPWERADLTLKIDNGISATPSQHRTRLPTPARLARHSDHLQPHNSHNGLVGKLQTTFTSMPRQPLSRLSPNKSSNSGMSGYGMSAGMKVGRQQPAGLGGLDHSIGGVRGF